MIVQDGSEPGWCESRGAGGARFIAEQYSPARERQDVVKA